MDECGIISFHIFTLYLPFQNMEHKYEYISVDDEISTHFVVEYVMRRYPEYKRKAHFTDPETALYYLYENSVDLMLLDVEMPEMDGFTLLDKIQNPPLTIMVTGYPTEYSERAHEYYDHGIIDFLSKSMEAGRFRRSLDRFEKLSKNIIIEKNGIDGQLKLQLENIAIQEADFEDFIHLYDILYVKVDKNYLFVYTEDGKTHKIRSTLQFFVDKYLSGDYFARVSRDTVVAMHHITSYNSYSVNMGKDENGNEHLVPIAAANRRAVEMKILAYLGKQE